MIFAILTPFDLFFIAVFRLSGGWGRQVLWHPYNRGRLADFWRRYNRPVTHLFYEDVFPLQRRTRGPIRATLTAFAFSALMHEYLFAVALWRIEGFQIAFFMIQGLAVVATRRLRPVGAWAVIGMGLTLAFNMLTGAALLREPWRCPALLRRGMPLVAPAEMIRRAAEQNLPRRPGADQDGRERRLEAR